MEATPFDLLVKAVHAGFDETAAECLEADLDCVDWTELVTLASRHRIDALAWHGLERSGANIPDSAAGRLSAAARAATIASMASVVECGRLQERLARNGIVHRFLKGATLAALAYRHPHLKSATDIDLLIDTADLSDAAALLVELGYLPTAPERLDTLEDWHRLRKESVWLNDDLSQQIDLHTGLADQPSLIPAIGINSPTQWIGVGAGIRLETLGDDYLFAYLCVHGISSCWFRLKWLVDLAAFLTGRPGPEQERLVARSLELGAGDAAWVAMRLCRRLFGIGVEAGESWRVAALERICLSQMHNIAEPTDRRGGTVPIRFAQCLLMPGPSYAIGEFARQAREILDRRYSITT